MSSPLPWTVRTCRCPPALPVTPGQPLRRGIHGLSHQVARGVPNQSVLTIACYMAKQAISQHGVPSQLLSGYEAAFLSNLMPELCTVTGTKKVNTTAYPETDGLVERFNCI